MSSSLKFPSVEVEDLPPIPLLRTGDASVDVELAEVGEEVDEEEEDPDVCSVSDRTFSSVELDTSSSIPLLRTDEAGVDVELAEEEEEEEEDEEERA